MKILINTASFFILLLTSCSTFSQAEMKPYIQTKGGATTDYDRVESTVFGKYNAYNGETKTKFSKKELKSVLIGKTGPYSTPKYAQLVFKSVHMSDGVFKYSFEDGNRPYEVIVSNGTDMILTEYKGTITSKRSLVANYLTSSAASGSNFDQIYYVKGTGGQVINILNMFKADFLDELIASFGSCEAVKTLLTGYKESSAKPIDAFEIIYNLKDAYYNNCYLK